ncbi:hypothetical protein [Adhaeribacter radiodurans]|uniref:Uncharacterized protein n=1 Tax=Adhaeribacter radiodurans TaxID=2745197 RepID=A0A7L7L7R7_9BACT|nr:hypothetical protein [Adhaeribacter radiodurans]QMU28872.1 hypothetical protein HUW48_12855 [Adhaeribacter radiodurans]
MKAISSVYYNTSSIPNNSFFKSSIENESNLLVAPESALALPLTLAKPKITVLDKSQLQELHKLIKSFQAQVRNSVALIKWLHAKTGNKTTAVSSTGQEPFTWQSSFGESLSFRFSTNSDAFTLFSDTLMRKSYFLHHHAQVDTFNQLIKVRVAVNRLPELEQELSIVFENIKPINYLETQLLQKQQLYFSKRQAG